MGVFKCDDCGNEVSTKATVCPNCGMKVAGAFNKNPILNTIGGIIGFVFLVWLVMYFYNNF
jgi:predicted RNA-binding Zn-ribbon protein involved in translation (DUF1610 family)